MRIKTLMRIAFYLIITALLFIFTRTPSDVVSGLITGIIVGDYLTWFFFIIPTILDRIEEGAWETLVNIVVGVTIFHFCKIDIPRTDDGMATMFFVFLLTFAIKAVFQSLKLVVGEETAGE